MDVFSLEDDDANELFLTQSSNSDYQMKPNFEILGNPRDFKSPCASLLQSHYEDITEDEFQFPLTQQSQGNSPKRNM